MIDNTSATNCPSRRHVLKWSGAGLATAFVFGTFPGFGISPALAADLGSGDIGVLNYAYALEQLEAAFYTQVTATPYEGVTKYEHQVLSDLKAHEVAHREFLRKALGSKAIPSLDVDFSSVDFMSRKSVLMTAKTFEDLGVAAYNGAGQLLKKPEYLVAAGSIVSVEARHAAIISDLLDPLSDAFVSTVDSNGLDGAMLPSKVLGAAKPFIKTPVTANGLV